MISLSLNTVFLTIGFTGALSLPRLFPTAHHEPELYAPSEGTKDLSGQAGLQVTTWRLKNEPATHRIGNVISCVFCSH